jgi:hypothetical protein
MSALATAFLLAAKKTPDEEGFDIILVMLATGLIFLAVVLLGQFARHLGHKRRTARARQRVY